MTEEPAMTTDRRDQSGGERGERGEMGRGDLGRSELVLSHQPRPGHDIG